MTRTALYARVSTDDRGQDPDNQLAELRRFAAAQAWEVTGEFVDYESGAKSDRPQFQALLKGASRREFDVLLFWSLDRLSREGALKTLQILDQLTRWGVAYRSFTESYLDSAGVFAEAIVALLATLAKQERLRLRERVRAGLDRARRQGKLMGRPRKVFDRLRVLELRHLDLSWAAIAKELGVTPAAARRAYRGSSSGLAENLSEVAR